MAIDQIVSVVREYFPATVGAILGAWNKRGEKNSIQHILNTGFLDKLSITFIALFAIIVGVCIGKWVSTALVGYYELPEHVVPVLEFITALCGIKIADSVVKGADKSLDVISEKLPSLVSTVLDTLSDKIKKWFS